MSYNRVVLLGNLTREPELKMTTGGSPILKFGLAMNRRYRGADQQMKEEATFVEVASFGRAAETMSKYLRKGQPLLVDGRLSYHSWENDRGEKRSRVDVVAERLQFVPRTRSDEDRASGGAAGEAPAGSDLPLPF